MKLLLSAIFTLALITFSLNHYIDKTCEYETGQSLYILDQKTKIVQCTLNHVVVHHYDYGYMSIEKELVAGLMRK